MPYSYLFWLGIFIVVPLVIIWIWQYPILSKYSYLFLPSIIGAILFTLPWDFISIKEQIWYFTTPQIVGIWFLGLPLEEWLFISLSTLLFATGTILVWEKFGRRV